jgi:penicillin-binding protein 1C
MKERKHSTGFPHRVKFFLLETNQTQSSTAIKRIKNKSCSFFLSQYNQTKTIMSFFFYPLVLASQIIASMAMTILVSQTPVPTGSQTIFARNGEILWDTYHPRLPSLEALDPFFIQALLTQEDQNFATHHGVDFPRVASAFFQNAKNNHITSGASTISMQLASQKYMPQQSHNWWFKIKQTSIALLIESQATKQDILLQYANEAAFFGANTTGVASAAQEYFNAQPHQLTHGQSIALVAMLPNPSAFNIRTNPNAFQKRFNSLVEALQKQNKISAEYATHLKNNPIAVEPPSKRSINAPHFVSYIQKQLPQHLTKKQRAQHINVHTTLDFDLYKSIATLAEQEIKNNKEFNINNAAIVVFNHNNQIAVMVGNVNFFGSNNANQINMATTPRQVGSTLKPFLYATALENNFTPLSGINDVSMGHRTQQGVYSPRNFNADEEYGLVHFREALSNSYNLSAINLLAKITIPVFAQNLKNAGIYPHTFAPHSTDFSIGLGTAPATLLNLTHGYSTLKNHGQKIPFSSISSITTHNGSPLYVHIQKPPTQVFKATTTDWITDVLSDNSSRWKNFSRGNALELQTPAAAKSGTSQFFKDNYIIGYSPTFTVGVWVGNTNAEPLHTASGIKASGPIWNTIMLNLADHNKFTTTGQRTHVQVCQTPNTTQCNSTFTEYLTQNEQDNSPLSAVNPPPVQITYPYNQDTLLQHSDLLIKATTYPKNKPVSFFINGLKTPPIIKNIPLGIHKITACNQQQCSLPVQITVQKPQKKIQYK